MRDLHTRIIDKYAVHWEKLGLILGLADYRIETISNNNKHNSNRTKDCCIAMFREWLRDVHLPTWGKLYDAIDEIEANIETMTNTSVASITGIYIIVKRIVIFVFEYSVMAVD